MKRSVEIAILAGFGLALVILIIVGVVSFRATLNVEAAAADRAHINQVRFDIQALLTDLQDTETGQRGYLLTGDERYLEPYAAAVGQIGTDTASLRALTADQPTQQQRLDTLGPLISAKLSELQQTIDLRRSQGFAAAQAVVLGDQGRQTMDAIRARLGDMQAEEDQAYQARDASLAAELATVRWIVVGGGGLAVLAVILALLVIRGELNNRRRADSALAGQAQALAGQAQALAGQAQALARERDQLQALLDNIPDNIYFKDRDSRFTRINPAQARLLGVPGPAAAVGKSDFDFQPESVSQPSFEREQQIIAGGQPLIDWVEYVPTPEGAPRWYSSTKIPLRNAAGEITGLVGISRDVTERQQTQAALEAQVQQRTRLLRMLSECNQSLVRATDEAELLGEICRGLVTFGGYPLAWVGLTRGAGGLAAAAQAVAPAAALALLAAPATPEALASLLTGGQPLRTRDMAHDPAWAPWQAAAGVVGGAAALALPFGPAGQPLGVLAVCAAAAEAFEAAELALLMELANDLAYGLATLRTRADLRRSDAMLRDTSQMARVGGWELDLLTRTLRGSEETYRIYQVDPSVAPNLSEALNFFAPEARPAITTAMETAITHGTPFNLELPFVTATGRQLWVRAQGQAEQHDGQTVRVWGAFQDITERRLAEENLRRSAERSEALARLAKSLGEVSTQYQAALPAVAHLLAEVVGDGCALYLISADGQWLETAAMDHRDPGAAEALEAVKAATPARADAGLSGRVLQTGQSLLIPIVDPAVLRASLPPEYGAYLARYTICSLLCVALRAEGKPLGTLVMSRSRPDRAYTAEDQSFLEVVAQRVALVIANARLYAGLEQRVGERTLSLQTEIAERERAEAEVRDLNQTLAQQVTQLDAANRELETFSYSVSHDLRAPLRAIDGFSMILLEDYGGQLDAAGRDYLGRVRGASQKMGELIDGMLALSRLTRAEMRREPVDLSALARATLADLRAADPQRQVDTVVTDGLHTTGDPRLLRAVLDNLLGNAWKFTGKTEHPRIEFGCLAPETAPAAPGQPEQVFFVRDNGAGFDMAHADRLFGAFQRLHREADFAGSGIGLATVQRVLHRHGGRAWAEAQPGQGATIYFALPLEAQ